MMPGDAWLAAVWEAVRGQLPVPPASVVEVGCGPLGGLVPVLRSAGYAATGVDPAAPRGSWYCPVEFEHYDMPEPADAIVACTSLHHVADLREVTGRLAEALAPGGVLVVVEWARERFDETTARWCFDRLPQPGDDPGWLNQRYTQWRASGQPWDAYLQSWAESEGLHAWREILRELRARFDSGDVAYGPYFFPDLAAVSEADEQAAIDRGHIHANRIQYTWPAAKPLRGQVMSLRATATVPAPAMTAAQAVNTRPPGRTAAAARPPGWPGKPVSGHARQVGGPGPQRADAGQERLGDVQVQQQADGFRTCHSPGRQ